MVPGRVETHTIPETPHALGRRRQHTTGHIPLFAGGFGQAR